jgi:hypothetical protein
MAIDTTQADVRRGERAAALMGDDLLTEAFATLEREYVEAWRLTAARDTDARERLWQAVQIVGKVRQHLSTVLDRGKLSAKELEIINAERERKKRFGIV